MDRLTKIKEVQPLDFDFEGKIVDIIEKLQFLIDNGWESIRDSYGYHEIVKYRLETDAEYAARMKKLDAAKEKRRKQYEKLKEEFEFE